MSTSFDCIFDRDCPVEGDECVAGECVGPSQLLARRPPEPTPATDCNDRHVNEESASDNVTMVLRVTLNDSCCPSESELVYMAWELNYILFTSVGSIVDNVVALRCTQQREGPAQVSSALLFLQL